MQYLKEQKVFSLGDSLAVIITEPARLLGIKANDIAIVSVPDSHIEIRKKESTAKDEHKLISPRVQKKG